jgi:hypothetical protein
MVSRRASTASYSTTENSYTFTGLKQTSTYTVRVRATDEARFSWWSDKLTVELPAAITVPLAAEKSAPSLWFDMLGRPVSRPQPGRIYIHDGKKVLY